MCLSYHKKLQLTILYKTQKTLYSSVFKLFLHRLVKDVRTLFKKNNQDIYIPSLSAMVSDLAS